MAQMIIRRPVTADTHVRCEICGGQSNTDSVFSSRFWFTPMLHPYLHLNYAVTTNKGRNLGTFHKAVFYRQSGSFG